MLTFHEEIKFNKKAKYFDRDQNLFKKIFYRMSEDYKKFYEFIEAIKYLSQNNNGYDIVLRPHPRDNMKNWEVVLEDIPNVYIIREDLNFSLGQKYICCYAQWLHNSNRGYNIRKTSDNI